MPCANDDVVCFQWGGLAFFGGIVQSSSSSSGSVVIADYSNQLTTVGDHFDNNQHLMNVRL